MCFLPGTLMLAVHNGLDKKYEQFAKDLLETCVQMYKRMPSGLSAELVYFNQGPSTNVPDITVRVSISTMYVFLVGRIELIVSPPCILMHNFECWLGS